MSRTLSGWNTDFLRQNMMGPSCVRLAEELLSRLDVTRWRRVLDLGCGMGLSSMYLAGTTPAEIVAFDLWIDATQNQERFANFGLEERILPLHGDVHAMPFARRCFDALVCIDSYTYYGAKPGFVDTHVAPYVKRGGVIALAIPGLLEEFEDGVPVELAPYWQEDIHFHTAAWWRDLLERSRAITVEECFSFACHAQAWNDWLKSDNPYAVRDRDMMRDEAGKYFDTIGIIARVL